MILKFLQAIGWICFSTLICFILFALIQWITLDLFELAFIWNNVSLFLTFLLFAYFFKSPFSIVGSLILILLFFTMLISSDSFYMSHGIQCILIISGTITGITTKKNKKGLSILILGFISLLFIYLGFIYYPKIEYGVPKTDLDIFKENRNFLIGHHGEHPVFNQDTVYLLNFSFYNCAPCHVKKKYTKQIANSFKNKPFKVIEIHSFESYEIFQRNYYFDYAETYDDSTQILTKLSKISGAPTELIFDKKGKAIRRLDGFGNDQVSTYLSTTKELINKLINEK